MESGANGAQRREETETPDQAKVYASAQTRLRRGRFTSVSSMIDEDEVDELEHKLEDLSVVVEQQNRMESRSTTSFIFGVNNSIKGLSHLLTVFENMNVNLLHIETRKSRNGASAFEIFVDVDVERGIVNRLLMELRDKVDSIMVQELSSSVDSHQNDSNVNGDNQRKLIEHTMTVEKLPWFPRKITDLDKVSNRVLMYGSELDADHPGFKDEIYRKRRNLFADIAFAYKTGERISRIDYTKTETETWGAVYRELMRLYPTHACKEFNENLPLLQKFCGYREDNIPQLEDVSNFLRDRTGFSLRPVAGYLSSRDFLAGLAFRVFNCTQYIRHPSDPFYTPEPDCCHELLGHVPLLADPSFALFSQEIGLVSLGASDEEVQKLATCYFFTVEFGLCKQDGSLRAYGAGLLSSIGELKHVFSGNASIQAFDPKIVMKQECLVTTFQSSYFYSPSFEDAKEKMREFAKTIKRPFDVRYNPYTQAVEILDTPRSIINVVNEMKGDLAIISNALKKVNEGGVQRVNRKCNQENGEVPSNPAMVSP